MRIESSDAVSGDHPASEQSNDLFRFSLSQPAARVGPDELALQGAHVTAIVEDDEVTHRHWSVGEPSPDFGSPGTVIEAGSDADQAVGGVNPCSDQDIFELLRGRTEPPGRGDDDFYIGPIKNTVENPDVLFVEKLPLFKIYRSIEHIIKIEKENLGVSHDGCLRSGVVVYRPPSDHL